MESEHSFEDLIEFRFLDLAISRLVHGGDELFDFLLGDLSTGFQVGEGIVYQVMNFGCLQGVAMVRVVFSEDGVDGISQLLIAV